MEKFSLDERQIALLGQGIIDLQGKIDNDMFQYVRDALTVLAIKDNPPIRVQISSSGGGVTAGLVIYDMLRLYPGETTGVVIGFAKSMAVVVLQACTTRLCMKNAQLHIHEAYRDGVSLDEIADNKKSKKTRDSLMREQAKIYLILEEKTGKSRSKIAALCRAGNADNILSAEQALQLGLIDKII